MKINYIRPWYKRIFHKHWYINSRQIPLATSGIYTKQYIMFKICNKCHKTKTLITWEKIKQSYPIPKA